MPTTLTFLSWARERIADLASTSAGGRAQGHAEVTLTSEQGTHTRTLDFLLAGPRDVVGLVPGAIGARYPVPGTIDAESDKATHVELVDPTLPWRYSPEGNPAPSARLRPWLALVVGTEGEELTMAGTQVTLAPAAQVLHPLDTSPGHWAHVQVDESGRRVARVVSARPLDPGSAYLAVLVPAFDPTGASAWSGAAPVTLPVYDHWRFETAHEPGSFRTLAGRLEPGHADANTGKAPVGYPHVAGSDPLELRGALAPIGASDSLLPSEIGDDLAALVAPRRDEVGRPIVGPPQYGADWRDDPTATTWGGAMNSDPRQRGVGGLGLELGIRLQEDLVAEASEHAGALGVAAQRIADLVLGLSASASLWRRRVPSDPIERLWLAGPGLRRIVTEDGPLADLATGPGRPLPRGIFSSAARRVLRRGPVRTALAAKEATAPGRVLEVANTCPPPPKPSDEGIVFGRGVGRKFDDQLRRALDGAELDVRGAVAAIGRLRLDAVPDALRARITTVITTLQRDADGGKPVPLGRAIELILASMAVDKRDKERQGELVSALDDLVKNWREWATTPRDLVDLLKGLREPPDREPRCTPIDLPALAEGVTRALDPTGTDAPSRRRVLGTLSGLDPAQPLAPPEVCFGLDRPVWRDVEGAFAEWLLPGVGRLPDDSVIALATNPVFIDALLTGYNAQLLAELRWRNHRVASRCTPLRVFWGRADTGSGDRVDDIVGIDNWPDASALGEPSHRPGGAAGDDLVVVFRGQLFLRYPRTLVYLVSAVHGGAPDFDADPAPDAAHVLPSFQGRIGADVTFFGFQGFAAGDVESVWVVLEEPPAGYRFYNGGAQSVPDSADAAAFAAAAFADPVRVLLRGDSLVATGGP